MAIFGYSMSAEEMTPADVVRYGARAEEVGFTTAWVSDHYHPWIDKQGQSPFVWTVLGGIAARTERLRLGTGVTCPTVRIHPAVIAQAVATTAALLPGERFFLGVGSGEALNEHILGDRWPPADVRLEMLEEAIEVLRLLWQGGTQSHEGKHYTVENARIYSLPEYVPPIYVSAFGPKATSLAARVGDGFVNTSPEAEAVQQYRSEGGKGPAVAGMKGCWATDEASAKKLAHELWPNSGLPGELAQELPTPRHFEQASSLVDEEAATSSFPCGPDADRWLEVMKQYVDAGFDEVYVQQIGPDQEGFFRFWTESIVPRLGELGSSM
jgi:G6PDH family F420-dependent oxidoreductase